MRLTRDLSENLRDLVEWLDEKGFMDAGDRNEQALLGRALLADAVVEPLIEQLEFERGKEQHRGQAQ
jgi:hypothetical protein